MKKDNLLTEYKSGILNKIKEFFRGLFIKNKRTDEHVEVINETKNIEESFILRNNLKEKINNNADSISEFSNDKLIEGYRKNPDILDSLSTEKLKELSEYYDELIAKCDEKLSDSDK